MAEGQRRAPGRRSGGVEAVGKNLIEDAPAHPGGGLVGRVVDGDLEGGRFLVVDRALAAQPVGRVSVIHVPPVPAHDEKVPQHARFGGQNQAAGIAPFSFRAHAQALFRILPPQPQRDRLHPVALREQAERDGGVGLLRAGGRPIRGSARIVQKANHSSSGLRCQILSLYSRMVRSLENTPDFAVFRTALRSHSSFLV